MNVGTLLTKAARTFPGNLAVVHGPRRLTYAQFHARVNRLANALARLGIGRGDHVALLQYNYPEGPGGPAEMVPGQHHVRMNMYIAQAKTGKFTIVKSLGAIDPKECM